MFPQIDLKTPLQALALAALTASVALPAAAEEEIIGSDEYRQSCLSCHGVGGRGDGPMAEHLTTAVPDLTTLSERNDGVFPLRHAIRVIDGRTEVAVHGPRTMPVWGARYSTELSGSPETSQLPWNRMATEQMVRGRILELINFLQAIQQPGGEPLLTPDRPQTAQEQK